MCRNVKCNYISERCTAPRGRSVLCVDDKQSPPQPEDTMESTYQDLARRLLSHFDSLEGKNPGPARLVIAISGGPGSGKSTIAEAVARRVQLMPGRSCLPKVAVVSMDGYHLPRAVLDQMPNREEMYRRRGAPFTFDAEAVVSLVRRCKYGVNETITAPSFDHALKDPVADGIVIPADTNIILIEGLYLLLDVKPWSQIGEIADEAWFVDVELGVAKDRVAERHVAAGIEKTMDLARRRVEANDELNAIYVKKQSTKMDIVIQSVHHVTTVAQNGLQAVT